MCVSKSSSGTRAGGGLEFAGSSARANSAEASARNARFHEEGASDGLSITIGTCDIMTIQTLLTEECTEDQNIRRKQMEIYRHIRLHALFAHTPASSPTTLVVTHQ